MKKLTKREKHKHNSPFSNPKVEVTETVRHFCGHGNKERHKYLQGKGLFFFKDEDGDPRAHKIEVFKEIKYMKRMKPKTKINKND